MVADEELVQIGGSSRVSEDVVNSIVEEDPGEL